MLQPSKKLCFYKLKIFAKKITLTPKFTIQHLPEVSSTNEYLINLTEKPNNENLCGHVIYADYQNNGKGTDNNTWISNRAENLLLSIALCTNIPADKQFTISKITSLSIFDYLKSKKLHAKIKWPNDILVNNKKICGILIENSIIGSEIQRSIIGIGININQKKFPEQLNATSLNIEKRQSFDIKTEIEILLNFFSNRINNQSKNNIDEEYFNNLIGINKFLKYRTNTGILNAKIHSINQYGQITLQTNSGTKKTFNFKEITLLLN